MLSFCFYIPSPIRQLLSRDSIYRVSYGFARKPKVEARSRASFVKKSVHFVLFNQGNVLQLITNEPKASLKFELKCFYFSGLAYQEKNLRQSESLF